MSRDRAKVYRVRAWRRFDSWIVGPIRLTPTPIHRPYTTQHHPRSLAVPGLPLGALRLHLPAARPGRPALLSGPEQAHGGRERGALERVRGAVCACGGVCLSVCACMRTIGWRVQCSAAWMEDGARCSFLHIHDSANTLPIQVRGLRGPGHPQVHVRLALLHGCGRGAALPRAPAALCRPAPGDAGGWVTSNDERFLCVPWRGCTLAQRSDELRSCTMQSRDVLPTHRCFNPPSPQHHHRARPSTWRTGSSPPSRAPGA